ncbi:S-adenosyl-L-methionine-dependent methyltransferase [Xylariaceae sp. FL0594]|nr:S-adenosyl-L-methionine-dependent methyltransferase [Xylariaceae sp. FL0594]
MSSFITSYIDEDDVHPGELPHLEQCLRDLRAAHGRFSHVPIPNPLSHEEDEASVLEYEAELDRLDNAQGLRAWSKTVPRNHSCHSGLGLRSVRHNGGLIKVESVVQVAERGVEEYQWEFLRVLAINSVPNAAADIRLRGITMTRTRNLHGLFPRYRNEVCALYDLVKADERDDDAQGAVEIPINDVIKTRALIATHHVLPKHRFNALQYHNNHKEIEDKARLVQRWSFRRYWPTKGDMLKKNPKCGSITHLTHDSNEIDDLDLRCPDDINRSNFRGGIVRGGSYKGGRICVPSIDIADDIADDDIRGNGLRLRSLTAEPNQKYLVDDIFCGASGASCGIRQAGFRIGLACDSDEHAAQSYQQNFPEAALKQMDLVVLIGALQGSNTRERPDVVHLSPPCQVYSPAHTRPGKNDSANVAALYLCKEYLNYKRPRISTGEQTFGLLHDRNWEFFTALVGQYTSLGYSFSWGELHFKHFGAPSIRKRLIWIASCPGEALPPFPNPTHGQDGLPPPITLRDAFKGLLPERRDPLHDVQAMLAKAKTSVNFVGKRYDDQTQVGTVTTSGSTTCHPSGQRNFTTRELASIQTFPKSFQFVGSKAQIVRQIGNAFPPAVVKALYEHLRTWLLHQNRVVPFKPPRSKAVITIPSAEDDYDDEVMEVPPPTTRRNRNNDDMFEISTRPKNQVVVVVADDSDSDVTVGRSPSPRRSRRLSIESVRSVIEMEWTINERHRNMSGRTTENHVEIRQSSTRGYRQPNKRGRFRLI